MNPINKLKAKNFLDFIGVKKYNIQDSGVTILENFQYNGLENQHNFSEHIKEIPIKLEKIEGSFYVKNLKSLKNFPNEITRTILIKNTYINSFKNFPIKICYDSFECCNCGLESLINIPIFKKGRDLSIILNKNNLSSLKGLPKDLSICHLDISDNPIKEIDNIEYVDNLEFSDSITSFGSLRKIRVITPHIISMNCVNNILSLLEKSKIKIDKINLNMIDTIIDERNDIKNMFVSKGYNNVSYMFRLCEGF